MEVWIILACRCGGGVRRKKMVGEWKSYSKLQGRQSKTGSRQGLPSVFASPNLQHSHLKQLLVVSIYTGTFMVI